MWPALAAGAGLGIGKYYLFDKPANDRQRALSAATQKYSPWTGLSAEAPDQINPMSAGMQGAATGAALGQNMAAQQGNANLQSSQIAANQAYAKTMATRGMGTQTADPSQFAMSPGMMDQTQNPWSSYRMQTYGY